MQVLPIILASFIVSFGLTPISRKLAVYLDVVDRPGSDRKYDAVYTPLMGGLAIYLSFVVAVLAFVNLRHYRELGIILVGATILAAMGLWDDRFDLRLEYKLSSMVIVSLGIVMSGIQIHLFRHWLDIPLTVLWIVTLINAVNFLDNMDGLAAGISSIAAFFFMLLAFIEGQVLVGSMAAAIFGGSLGFLIYNFNPASSFMGDMGSLVLGMLLSILGIKLTFQTQPLSISWMFPILVLALPLFDIVLVVVTRLLEGRSPGEAGKDHTSHRLQNMGLSTQTTVLILYGICVMYGLFSLFMRLAPLFIAFIIGLASIISLLVFFIILMYMRYIYQR